MIGVIGELHPRFIKEMDIANTICFELELQPIIDSANVFNYKPINKYPTVSRDLAIVVKKDILAEDILALVRQTARKNLVGLELFDLYTGENVGADEKSLAIKLTLEDTTKTLESADVDKIIKSILNRLEFTYNAKLRN